jgi:hypothetical protein
LAAQPRSPRFQVLPSHPAAVGSVSVPGLRTTLTDVASALRDDGCVPIFDSILRADATPARHSEGTYSFLNRAAGEPWESIRAAMEAWLAEFPVEGREDVRRRLQSSGYREFSAAYWELYLHTSLSSAGYFLEVHPRLPYTDRRPDFLVSGPIDSFYLEARRVSESDAEIAAERRRSQIYDSLDRISSSDFFLWIEIEHEGPGSMPRSLSGSSL